VGAATTVGRYEVMAADPIWSDASPDELEESKTLMEKRFLCHIYEWVPVCL
jgi:hypothetical protein